MVKLYDPMSDGATRINRKLILTKPGHELELATIDDSGEVVINNTYERPLSALLKAFLGHENLSAIELVLTEGDEIVGKKHLEPEGANVREAADLLVLSGVLLSAEAVLDNPSRPETFRESEIRAATEVIRNVRELVHKSCAEKLSTNPRPGRT